MSLPSWLKRSFAALMLILGLSLAVPSPALAAGTNQSTPGCGQTTVGKGPSTSSIENSDLLPVVRWSDATGSIHSRLDGKWYGDITQKLQRNVEDSSFMSLGNTEFSTSTQILEMAGDFCPGTDSAVKVDQTAGKVGGDILDLHSAYAWGWVSLLLVSVIIKELWTARRTGSVNWNPIMRFGGLTVALALLVTQASSSNGQTLAKFSPGWIINQMEQTSSKLATTLGAFGNPEGSSAIAQSIASKPQVDIAKTNALSCVNYETMMIEEFQAKYESKGSIDGRGAVPLLMNRMWMNTGLRAYTETQYGSDNMYGPQVACRGLEWNSGRSANDQYNIEQGDAAGKGTSETLDQANNDAKADPNQVADGYANGKVVKLGFLPAKPKFGVDKSFWYGYASDNNQRWDTDMIWVAACGYDGSKWFVQPGWKQASNKDNPTDGVYNHDNSSAKTHEHGALDNSDPDNSSADNAYTCANAYAGGIAKNGTGGNNTFGNWQDGQGTLSAGTPPNGSVADYSHYNSTTIKDAGGANPRDFISNLHGYTSAGSAVSALLYPVTGLILLVVFGGLGLVIFGLRFALLLAILAMIFVVIWALIRNSMDPVNRFFKMLLGAMFISFMYLMILSIIDVLTTMFLDLSGTFEATSTGVSSVIWTALAPLFSVMLFRWFWDRFIKAPNPLSLKGGMSYGRAAAEGVVGVTAASMLARGARGGVSRFMNSTTSALRGDRGSSSTGRLATSPIESNEPQTNRPGAMPPAGDDLATGVGAGIAADEALRGVGEAAPGSGQRGAVMGADELLDGAHPMVAADGSYTMPLPRGADDDALFQVPGGQMDSSGQLRAPTAEEQAIAAAAGARALPGGGYARDVLDSNGNTVPQFLTNGEYSAARAAAGLGRGSSEGDEGRIAQMTGAEAGITSADTALGSMYAGTARHLMDARARSSSASLAERARRGAAIHGDLNQLAAQAAVSNTHAKSRLAERIGEEDSRSVLGFGDGRAFGSERLGKAISTAAQGNLDMYTKAAAALSGTRLGRSDMANALAGRVEARRYEKSVRQEKYQARMDRYRDEDGNNKSGAFNAVGRSMVRASAMGGTMGRVLHTSAKTAPKAIGGSLAVGALAGGLAPVAMVAGGAAGAVYAAKAARATTMRVAPGSRQAAQQAKRTRNIALADRADAHQRQATAMANRASAEQSTQRANSAPPRQRLYRSDSDNVGTSSQDRRAQARRYGAAAVSQSSPDITGKDRP